MASELGTRVETWGGQVRFALVYPNSYYIGMSNLGFQSIYALLNQQPGIHCERFFWLNKPESDCPYSFETGHPVQDFQVLAFSVSYELDFINILSFLTHARIPHQRNQRHRKDPLVLLGGAAVSINPESLADCADLVVLGEGENVVGQLAEVAMNSTHQRRFKENFLEGTRNIDGVYQPRGYSFDYEGNSVRYCRAEKDYPEVIIPAVVENVDDCFTHSHLLSDHTEFKNHFLMEVSRGCSRRCRFCYGGWGTGTFRCRSLDVLKKYVMTGRNLFEQRRRQGTFGLISAAFSEVPAIVDLMDYILHNDGRFSLSSLPLRFLRPEIIERLSTSGVSSVTLAPEAGTEKLRKIIRKEWHDDLFFSNLSLLWDAQITRLKLYFLIGLPGETDSDIHAIGEFVKEIVRLKEARPKKVRQAISIHISVNAFIPKPRTPFQWFPMAPEETLRRRFNLLQQDLRKYQRVILSTDSFRWARIQALISRGDRRVFPLLQSLAGKDISLRSALTGQYKKMTERTMLTIPFNAVLPWDHLTAKRHKDIVINNVKSLNVNQTDNP